LQDLELSESNRYSEAANAFTDELNLRVDRVFGKVRQQQFWKVLISQESSNDLLHKIFRELFLSIYWYQKHTTEAGFLMLGRLPKHEQRLLRSLLAHKAEEAMHGEWALRDYLALGGHKEIALSPPSPATFAVAAVWWRMATVEEPMGYLGAEHLFEYLTALVTGQLLTHLEKRGFDVSRVGFIVEHATEDVKHTNLIRHWIAKCVTEYPESVHAMRRCFDYFENVYPLPVWNEASERALADKA
jgi:hypothetical protein